MLTLWLMVQLQDSIDNFILQLDGAPPHWSTYERDYLEHLPHQWIGYITNHSTTDLTCYASFGVHSHHSTGFAAQWNVRQACIVSLTLDWKPQAANGAMNGGHGQRNRTTLCLLTNSASACNITMVGFEFGDTVVRDC
ncbi:hypothetical protein TNCV_3474501 [Trichonephila clavipes]|nr:hypothetical protein TNCV_3474501 [Trichonephila clavipes]